MLEKTIKCPICGKPYKFMGHYAGDQSACRKCVNEAERAMVRWAQGDRERSRKFPLDDTDDRP